eukprot:5337374-Karenia_brevis.AAC.1
MRAQSTSLASGGTYSDAMVTTYSPQVGDVDPKAVGVEAFRDDDKAMITTYSPQVGDFDPKSVGAQLSEDDDKAMVTTYSPPM